MVPVIPHALIAFAMSWKIAGKLDSGRDASVILLNPLIAFPMFLGAIEEEVPDVDRMALAMLVNTESSVT